jgi:hypothetical protein
MKKTKFISHLCHEPRPINTTTTTKKKNLHSIAVCDDECVFFVFLLLVGIVAQ